MKRNLSLSLLFLSLLLFCYTKNLEGYQVLGLRWFNDDMPVNFYVNLDYIEETVPYGYQEEAVIEGFRNWEEVECASIYFEYMGTDAPYGFNTDGLNVTSFGDKYDWLSSGVLAVTYPIGDESSWEKYNDYTFYRYLDADILFNDGINWGTIEDVESASCVSDFDMLGVATHEIGHAIGMGHSCESYDPCNDPSLREATMYWAIGPCDSSQSDLAQDDIDGLNFIYGVYVDFSADKKKGSVPLTVQFSLLPEGIEEEITYIQWNFGDNEMNNELSPIHTYIEQGQWTVTLNVTGTSGLCNFYEKEVQKKGYITVCDVPSPDFSYEVRQGRRFRFINKTPFEVYGCVTGYQWDFGDGTTSEEKEPYHTFDQDGRYTVTLIAEGPAGSSEPVSKDIDVYASGCSFSAGGGFHADRIASLLLLPPLLILMRRKETVKSSI